LGGAATALLRRLDAEDAHRATILGLRLAPCAKPPPRDANLETRVFGLEFSNPLGLAAGFDKNAEVFIEALGLGFGFVEVGTLTPLPQAGNARPRVFRLYEDRAIVNRYGFNNDGHEAALRRLDAPRRRHGIVGVNIGANKETPDKIGDFVAGVKAFAEVADYIAINISSPNTPGLRDLQAPDALEEGGIIDEHRPPVPQASQALGRIEAERGQAPEGGHGVTVVAGSMGLAGVLHQGQAPLSREFPKGV